MIAYLYYKLKNNKMTKNERIKQSLKETREKRENQICKSFQIKIDKSHLSNSLIEQLEQLFREGKWFYNSILNSLNDNIKLKDIDASIKIVQVKKGDNFEQKQLNILSSQMKQSLHRRIGNSLSALHQLKLKGYKVGTLKYKSEWNFNCIPLKQFGNTYRIINNKYISIQSIKGNIRVNGLNQISKLCDIADAKLIKTDDDYYVRITCYIDKDSIAKIEHLAYSVGIDFGISNPLTLSDGTVIDYETVVSKRTKRQQKQLKRKIKNSNNYNKIRKNIRKSHNKSNNQKKDITNKIVHALKHTFKHVIYQDENLKFFQKGHGKGIQNTRLGGIITSLNQLDTSIQVSRYFPSTKLCFCGYKKKDIKLSDRTYICPECGLVLDRDYKSSISIEDEGLRCNPQILTERKNFKPVENLPSAVNIKDYFISNPNIKVRKIQEAARQRAERNRKPLPL